jgi:DNA invertase Pin-like site-specific DNA recombinase
MTTITPINEGIGASKNTAPRAAAYVRMSTDHQQFSIANQLQVISEYAVSHGIEIVRTYSDPARSGLTLQGRDALKQLIADVVSGQADFTTILVYDVSRWGRFQDTDESAHFEFICRKAGVAVEYCAEEFQNDGSALGALVKSIKRVMAAEYSRELSAKVARAQARLARLGFHQGGTAGFGLRRMLVDRDGVPKCMLKVGETKHLHDDRVILVPGPKEEIRIVRKIFRMYNEQGFSPTRIAQILNKQGYRTERGNSWGDDGVRGLLRCERFIGNLIYNISSYRLGQKRILNRKEQWVRIKGAIKPIIKTNDFAIAQKKLDTGREIDDRDLLNHLTAVWCVTGHLSCVTMSRVPHTPAPNTYTRRFGSLENAFDILGYRRTHTYRYKDISNHLCRIDRELICNLTSIVPRQGGTIRVHPESQVLEIDGGVRVGNVIVPFTKHRDYRNERAFRGWILRLEFFPSQSQLLLIVRMNLSNTKILDYHLVPRTVVPGRSMRLTEATISQFSRYRLKSLSNFYEACRALSATQTSQLSYN